MGRFLQRRRGYLRPTKVGIGYGLIFLLALLAAWNTGTNLLYIVVGGLASFIVLSFAISFFLIRGLTMHRSAPQAVYRGQPFQVHVRIENHRRWIPAVSLFLERDRERGTSNGHIFYLPPGEAGRLSVEECFHNRGEHPLAGYRIICGFPFGLMERCKEFDDRKMVLVYPRVHPVRASAFQRLPGRVQMSTQASDDGDEFFGLREYVPGDDIRRIVWRISARLGKWIVREHGHYQSRLVILALNNAYDPGIEEFNEQFERAVELTASIAIMLLRRRNEVSIVTATGFLEGGDGRGHERRVLEMLARVRVSDGSTDMVRELKAVDSASAAVFIISPDPDSWGRITDHGRVLDPGELVHG